MSDRSEDNFDQDLISYLKGVLQKILDDNTVILRALEMLGEIDDEDVRADKIVELTIESQRLKSSTISSIAQILAKLPPSAGEAE